MLALVFGYFAFGELGHPSFRVREAASRRADCLLGASLAPTWSPDPEVRRRAVAARDRWHGRWLGAWAEYAGWRASEDDPDGLLLAIHAAPPEAADRFLLVYPLPVGMSHHHLRPPLLVDDLRKMRWHLAGDRMQATGAGAAWCAGW